MSFSKCKLLILFSERRTMFLTYHFVLDCINIPFVMLALFLDIGQFRRNIHDFIDSIKVYGPAKRLAELISLFIETQKWNIILWGVGVGSSLWMQRVREWRKFVNSARLWGQLFTVNPMQHIFVFPAMQRSIQPMHFLVGICEASFVTCADTIQHMFDAQIIKCSCVAAVIEACMMALPSIRNR